MSLYRITSNQPILPSEEVEGIPIDAQNIFEKNCYIEVYIHPTGEKGIMSISPNNASFLMSVANPLLSFFGATVIPYSGGHAKMMIAMY